MLKIFKKKNQYFFVATECNDTCIILYLLKSDMFSGDWAVRDWQAVLLVLFPGIDSCNMQAWTSFPAVLLF